MRDIVLLNSAAGLTAWNLANDPSQFRVPILDRLAEQLEVAAQAIDSGAAAAKLDEWVAATQQS